MTTNQGETSFYRGDGIALADTAAAGNAPVWNQIAKCGSFKGHAAGPFEITTQTFEEIVRNFRATQNQRICIDFEHSSEADETSGSIPTTGAPAQGWVIDLRIQGDELWGLVEWLPLARDYVRAGQYRYFSPAIRFGSKDRVTGKPIGARLSSVALVTNPFLDGLAPLAASERQAMGFTALTRVLMRDRGLGLVDAQVLAASMLRHEGSNTSREASAAPERPAHSLYAVARHLMQTRRLGIVQAQELALHYFQNAERRGAANPIADVVAGLDGERS